MASFTVEDLYVAKAKSPEELQAAIDAPRSKAGKDKAEALLLATDAHLRLEDTMSATTTVKEALAVAREVKAEELEAVTLCLLAKVRMGGTYSLEAMQAANRAMRTFKELGDKKGEAAALYVVSLVLAAASSPGDAAWKAGEARKLFKAIGEKAGDAACLQTMAACYVMQDDFKKGLTAAQDAVDLFKELGDKRKEGASLSLKAKMHLGLGEPEVAVQAAKEALSVLEQAGGSTADAVDVLISSHTRKGDYDDAIFVAQNEADRLNGKGDKVDEADVLCKIADVQLLNQKPDQAYGLLIDAGNAYKSGGDKKGVAKVKLLAARLQLDRGQKKEAETLSNEAIALHKELGDEGMDGLLDSYVCLSSVAASNQDMNTAFQVLLGPMNDFQASGFPRGQGAMVLAIADLQVKIQDYAGALDALKTAPPLLQAGGDKKREAQAWAKLVERHAAKQENGLAMKAAEEATKLFRGLGNKKDLANADLLLATAHFALSSKGNGREAKRAAEEAVAIYQAAGDKRSHAGALCVLANALLMNQSWSEAKSAARSSEQIFLELGDINGQANALVMVAGATLGEGDFAQAKDVVKEAREHFRDIGNAKGEDGAEDFLDALKSYEGGSSDKNDFMGFTMGILDPKDNKPQKKTEDGKKKKAQDTTLLSNVDVFGSTGKGEKQSVTFFDAFEARRATAPTRGPAARRRASAEAAAAAMWGDEGASGKKAKDPVVFSVRWVPDEGAGEEKKPAPSTVDVEDRRIALSMALGQPSAKFPGNCGKTERMFGAMGDQKGVA